MRVCSCVLGMWGKCCQDCADQGAGYSTTLNTLGSGYTYTYGWPRRVRKSPFGERPWVVTNHPAGTMCFKTWREAIEYANTAYYTINSAVS